MNVIIKYVGFTETGLKLNRMCFILLPYQHVVTSSKQTKQSMNRMIVQVIR